MEKLQNIIKLTGQGIFFKGSKLFFSVICDDFTMTPVSTLLTLLTDGFVLTLNIFKTLENRACMFIKRKKEGSVWCFVEKYL